MIKHKINKKFTVNKSDSIISVLSKFNKIGYNFQLIVNKKKLLGTVSDGDIRRGLLMGVNTNESIEKCMNKKPIVGYDKNPEKFMNLLKAIPSLRKFLFSFR